jgi:hypothetical protein
VISSLCGQTWYVGCSQEVFRFLVVYLILASSLLLDFCRIIRILPLDMVTEETSLICMAIAGSRTLGQRRPLACAAALETPRPTCCRSSRGPRRLHPWWLPCVPATENVVTDDSNAALGRSSGWRARGTRSCRDHSLQCPADILHVQICLFYSSPPHHCCSSSHGNKSPALTPTLVCVQYLLPSALIVLWSL